MEGLREELHRTRTNEKRLMDINKELKNKLSHFMSAGTSLKKERVVVAKLKKIVSSQELHVDRLREELTKVKTELVSLETNRAKEKNTLEQRIVDLEKKSLHFENCFFIEKTLREQKEKELEKLCGTNEKNKKLTKQLQTLEHELQELKGYKSYATKAIGEGREQLKKNEMENHKKQVELNKMKSHETHTKHLEEELMSCRKSLKSAMTTNENREKEIKQQAKQVDEYKEEIYCLTKKTVALRNTVQHHSVSIKTLEDQVHKLKQDKINLRAKSEKEGKENEQQSNRIRQLEDKLNTFGHLKIKLDERDKEIARLTVTRDEQIVHLQSLINELEKRLKLQITETEQTKAERDRNDLSLLKAQQELDLKNKTMQDLHNEIRDQRLKINAKNLELVKIKKKYCSVKKRLEKLKRELVETKRTQEIDKISASRDWILAEKGLTRMAAEKKQFEEELVHSKETILQQQLVINLQEAGKVTQEVKLREHIEEVDFLRQEIKILNQKVYILDKTRLGNISHFLRRERTRAKTRTVKPHVFIGRKLETLEKKDKEIEELKRMLARRPDDAIQKLQQCQWAKRSLYKKFMALQGGIIAYEAKYKSVMEENKRLTDELRKLKLEKFTEKTKNHLPPISNKAKSPSESKPECKFKPWHISRHTRFPIISTKSQCRFDDIFKTIPLPPIGSNLRPKQPSSPSP